MTRTRGGLIVPIAIIAAGVVALLVNLGVIRPEALANHASLWPLVLIVVGLWIAFSRLLAPRTATIANLAVLAVAVIIAVVAVSTGSVNGAQARSDASAPLGGLTTASVDISSGALAADVNTDDLGNALYEAHFDYPSGERAPTARLDRSTGAVTIAFGQFRNAPFFGGGKRHLDLTVNSKVAWAVSVHGGAADLTIDISDAHLRSLEVSGGASHVDATLGAPTGSVAVTFSGGASSIDLHLPQGTAWRAQVNGGPSTLEVNGSSNGGLGNLSQQSSGYDTAADRYDVMVNGGASRLAIDTG
jgi:hypothetical protein